MEIRIKGLMMKLITYQWFLFHQFFQRVFGGVSGGGDNSNSSAPPAHTFKKVS